MDENTHMINSLMNEYGYRESGTDDLLMPHVLTDTNSVGYGGGVESLTEGSWPFDQPYESNGPTPMATIDPQSYYGGSSDTGFELLDISIPDIIIPAYSEIFGILYSLTYYGILHDGYNLPNFTKLSVDGVEYNIYPMPEEMPESAGCYLAPQQILPVDSQEVVDEIAEIGVDVKIGDTMVVMPFALVTEQVLSGDVPFIMYAGQDSWSGTLHGHVDTSAAVYGAFAVNSDSTAYELTIYTDNCSNPQFQINDGEWQAYDENNKPEIYKGGPYNFKFKAISDYDGSEIYDEFGMPFEVDWNEYTCEGYSQENPSSMFAGADIWVNSSPHLNNLGSLIGRNDVTLQYKIDNEADWHNASLTNTSAGYYARIETGWGSHKITLQVLISGEIADNEDVVFVNNQLMSPYFDGYTLYDSNGNMGPFIKLRFGANYPDINTVEEIRYWYDDYVWHKAVHDTALNCELALAQYDETGHLKTSFGFSTVLIQTSQEDSLVESQQIHMNLPVYSVNEKGLGFNNASLELNDNANARDVFPGIDFKVNVIPDSGYNFVSLAYGGILFDVSPEEYEELGTSNINPQTCLAPAGGTTYSALYVECNVEPTTT